MVWEYVDNNYTGNYGLADQSQTTGGQPTIQLHTTTSGFFGCVEITGQGVLPKPW